MDTVTHALAGAVLYKTGIGGRLGKAAAVVFILGSLVPDLDFVMRIFTNAEFMMKHHRGITNSIFGIPIIAIVFSLLVQKYYKRKGVESNLKELFLFSLLVMVVHNLLDIFTSYGTMIFYPFSFARVSWNVLFIVDFYVAGAFILALVVPLVMRNEIKAKAKKYPAVGVLGLFCVYIIIAGVSNSIVKKRVEVVLQNLNITADKIIAYPGPFSPLNWMVVAEDKAGFYVFRDVLRLDAFNIVSYKKYYSDTAGLVNAAKDDPLVDAYLWFADFPYKSSYMDGDDRILEIRDLRFGFFEDKKHFVLRARISKAGELKEVTFEH
ncbi:MAG: metal-dependent hydrolase [Deltaproteobacteria bacterium]|nr:metal-dependent hydrolase [Deltaproteobacteria bacterium]